MSLRPSFLSRRLAVPVLAASLAGLTGLGVGLQTTSAQADGQSAARHHRVLNSPDAPAAIGPYSQGIGVGPQVFLSGQLPLDPATNQIPPGATIRDQTRQVLENLAAVLASDGMSLADVVSTTVYLANIDDFAAFNEVYAEYFTEKAPARATVQVARIPRGALVEISAIAIR
jgi:2-iminobutanoate/2-iminopropanoate deaminase